MESWQLDQLHGLCEAENEQEIFAVLSAIAKQLGFDYCAYGMRIPIPISHPRIVTVNNYPAAWQELYQDRNYLAIDPTVQHGIRSLRPIVWSDAVFSSAKELWENAQAMGLRVGLAQSACGPHGSRGMLTVARSNEPLSEKELCVVTVKLAWLTQVAHLAMSEQLMPKLLPELDLQLSRRESEVLRWTADGKTSWEVSEILGISERTVNFHINNAVRKLGAPNKLAATARAAALGILQ